MVLSVSVIVPIYRFLRKFSLILLVILTTSSCCNRDLLAYIEFPLENLDFIPYDGSEELKFIDNNEEEIIYSGGGRETDIDNIDDCKGGCCDYYIVETLNRTSFYSDFMESNFQLIIYNGYNLNTGKYESFWTRFSWLHYDVEPYVTATSYKSLPIDSTKAYGINEGIYADSISLRGHVFNEIYILQAYPSYPERLYPDTLYYSISEGIVGLSFSDGNLWVIE